MKTTGIVFGIIYLIIGILGLLATPLIGGAGYFVTNTAFDIINIIVGIIFLVVAFKGAAGVAMTSKIIGIIYVLLAIIGFFTVSAGATGSVLGFIDANGATNWLNLILGIIVLAFGFKKSEGGAAEQM